MRKYFEPFVVFFGGNLALLVVLLLFPAIGTASTALAANTTAIASTFWGWTWVVSGTRLWVFLGFEAVILWGTAKAFLRLKSN